MKARETAEVFEQIAREIREYLEHPCYDNEDTELRLLIHDPDLHHATPRTAEIELVNGGKIIHGGHYQKHLLIRLDTKRP